MADNHFDLVLVWDNLGGAVRINRGGKATVTDPATGALVTVVQDGQPTTVVTADSNGRVSFVAQQGLVKLTSGGLPINAVSAEQAVAGAANAAAAQDAQVAAEAARDDAQTAASNAAAATSMKVDKASLVVNVLDHGATGDGTTDDTTAIQAALDAAASASSFGLVGEVLLPGGTYVVSHIEVGSNVTLRGQGGATLKHKAAAIAACVQVPSTVVGASIIGVEVDGNASNQTAQVQAIRVDGERSLVADCYVHDVAWDGIIINAGAARWVTVRSNRVKTTGRYGITLTANLATDCPENVVVAFNHVEASNNGALGINGVGRHVTFVGNTTRDHGGDGIAAYNPNNEDITCTGNTFHNPGNHAIHLGGRRLVISGNTADNVVGGHGWFIHNSDLTTAYTASITGNSVTGTQAGESVRVEYTRGVTISGNTCTSTYRHGIYSVSCTDLAITGNVVDGTSVGSGIYLKDSQRSTIVGNVVTSPFSVCILADGTSSNGVIASNITTGGVWGVKTNDSSTDFRVADNTINGPSTGTISLVGGAYSNYQQPSVRMTEGTAAPTVGTWARGDQVRNSAPTAGGVMGWVCVTAGTPGAWKAFGTISA